MPTGCAMAVERDPERCVDRVLDLPFLRASTHADVGIVGQLRHGASRAGSARDSAGAAADGSVNVNAVRRRLDLAIDRASSVVGAGRRRLAAARGRSPGIVVSMPSKKLLLLRRAPRRCDCKPLVVRDRRARLRDEAAAVLRALKAQARARRTSGTTRRARGRSRRYRPGSSSPRSRARRPCTASTAATGRRPLGELLGEHLRVAGRLERLLRDQARRLVIAVAVALVALEARDDARAAARCGSRGRRRAARARGPTCRAPRPAASRTRSRPPS